MSATRPGQNSNGQAKQPSANPNGQAAQPQAGQQRSTAPHPALLSNLRINYANLQPVEQAQVAEKQLGVDPYATLNMGQQQVAQASQLAQAGNPQQGLAPNALSGPGVPEGQGLENFPHDMNALLQLMRRGYSPGSSPAEHMMAQNAHAIARAQEIMAQQNAQNGLAHASAVQQLGGAFQNLMMSNQLPPPEAVANHVMQANPGQLQSAMMGGAQPGMAPTNY